MAGTQQVNNTIDYTLGVNSLSFAAGAGNFLIGASGVNTLSLGSGGITNSSSVSQTLNVPLILAANQTWTNSTVATQVTFNGAIATGGSNLTFAGAGSFSVQSAITGGGTITKTGTGLLNLFQTNTNTAFNISGGTVSVNLLSAVATNPLGTGTVTMAAGTTLSFRNTISLTPITFTAGSFNQDVIASATDSTTAAPFGTTASVDTANFVFFERGRPTGPGTNTPPNPATDGLPSGGFLTSISNSNQTFQLQPYGSAAGGNVNNVMQVTGTNSGTMTLQTAASFSQIAIANTTGSGPTTFNVVLNFADSTTTTYTGITGQNWFGGTGAIINGLDRMLNTTGVYASTTPDPQIYSTVLTLSATDQAKQLASVTFVKTNATGNLNVFAISGGFLSGYSGGPTAVSYTNNFVTTGAATLDMGALSSLSIGTLTLGGVLTVSSTNAAPALTTGTLSLTANAGMSLPTGMVYTPPAPITGAFTFTKSGAGQINLTQANTFSALTVSAGTAAILPATAATNPLSTGTVTLSGGTISFRGTVGINPIALTPASYNQDVVASVLDPQTAPFGTTTSVDDANFIFYEHGRTGGNLTITTGGLPSSGTLISVSNPNQKFQLQGYGTAAANVNNVMKVGNNGTAGGTGTITLVTPASYSQLAIATTTGSGPTTYNANLNFQDGSTTTYTGITGQNWFNGTNPIIAGLDRLNTGNGNYDNNTTNPQIYGQSFSLSATDAAKLLTSITFTKTASAGALNVFALSGGSGPTTQSYTNNVTVTASSTIDVTDLLSVTLGNLTIGSTLNLTTTSGTAALPVLLTMGTVTITANSTFNYPNTITPTWGQFSDGGTARTITKNGTGIFTIAAAAGTGVTTTPLNLAGGSTFTDTNGTINLNATNSISATANGNLTLNVAAGTVNMTVPSAFSTTTGNVTFGVTGGTINLNGANALTTAGKTIFTQSAGTVNANAATVFGNSSTTITGNGGALNIAAGNNYSIGSLNSTTTANAAAQQINLNGTTLTINGSDGTAATTTGFRGRIFDGSAAGSVVVTGGTTLFSSANPYSGGLTVTGGKVTGTMPGTIGSGSVTLGNGTLVLAGIPASGLVNGFTSSAFTANGGATINADTSATITTTASTNQARSIFSTNRLPVASNFTVGFRYSQTNTTDPANGVTITIQGAQPTAVGGNAANFAASGISPSFTLAMNVQEVSGGVSPGVNAFQNGAITATFFNPPSPGFPDPLQATPGSGLELYVQLSYDAASGTFSGQYGQRSPLNPTGPIIYIPLSQAQAPIGAFNGVIPAANMAYNLLQNIGGGAYIGVTGSTGGTATQNTTQTIDQFVIYGADSSTAVPAATTYNQAFIVNGGTTATVNVLTKTGAEVITAGPLTIGAGSTGLTVGADSGSVANGFYGLTFGATTLNGNPTFTVNNNGTGTGTLTLGALNDGGTTASTITKAGAGTLTLGTAATSLVAGTQVNVTGGTLNLNIVNAIGTLAQLTTSGGTTVNVNAGTTVAGLAGAGALNLGGNTLIVNGSVSGSYSGVISGSGGSLLKAGTGTLTLTGANGYSGATTVNAGTLAVNNATGSATGTGLTSVNATATIMGTGNVGGGLTINSGGTMAPGNSIGTMTAAGVTTWASGGTYTVEYTPGSSFTSGSTIDYYNSTGTLNVTATSSSKFTINLKNAGGGTAPATTTAVIATFTGTSGSGFSPDRFNFTGDFAGTPSVSLDASNNVVLAFTPVPEPVTLFGLAGGALGVAGWVRRRTRRTA
jgi:autotransporter-associated beta strand protein